MINKIKSKLAIPLQLLLLFGFFIILSLPSAVIMGGFEKLGIVVIFAVLLTLIGFFLTKTKG